MPKTLLAVDDSVTMRKVVEMTFAGEDQIRVVTVATAQEALAACHRAPPDIVLADVALDGHSGYDLCRAIKESFARIPVVLVASKQNPYDPARAQAVGADDHADKPWDTAKIIDLVKKVLAQGQSVAHAPIAAAPIASAPAAPRAPMFAPPLPIVSPASPAPVIQAAPQQPPHPTMQGMTAQRPSPPRPHAPALQGHSTVELPDPQLPGAPPAAPERPALTRAHTPALQRQQTVRMTSEAPPAAPMAPAAPVAAVTPVTPVTPVTNGAAAIAIPPELAGKLDEIGLTPAQADAVLALSREIVERVVWEVVPVLAETMIKEEIARLTRE